MNSYSPPLITILGPTASGKTALSIALAKILDGEIISADSRQVFRGMSIGTGKDLKEYGEIPYHLIDIRNAGDHYDVSVFQKDFYQALNSIHLRKKRAILCGGSGMYIQSVLQDFKHTSIPKNEELREALEKLTMAELTDIYEQAPLRGTFRAEVSTKKRLIRAIEIAKTLEDNPAALHKRHQQIPHLIFGLNPEVDIRRECISRRLQKRMEEGLIEEVESLLDKGVPMEKLIQYGLEYKWVTLYLKGELDYSTMYARMETSIHQYAKRQMTYFRKMEKDGLKIHWL